MAYVNATVGSNTAKVTSVTDGTNTLATLAAVVENDSNLTVTENGTYNAAMDGYKKVIVNVPASAGSSPAYMQVVDFTPSADTNEDQTFTFSSLTTLRSVAIYAEDWTTVAGKGMRSLVGFYATSGQDGGYTTYASSGGSLATGQDSSQVFDENAVTVKTYMYGGTKCYFRSGVTYHVVGFGD